MANEEKKGNYQGNSLVWTTFSDKDFEYLKGVQREDPKNRDFILLREVLAITDKSEQAKRDIDLLATHINANLVTLNPEGPIIMAASLNESDNGTNIIFFNSREPSESDTQRIKKATEFTFRQINRLSNIIPR